MYGLTDLKPGRVFELNNEPYLVLSSQHSKQARGGAILRSKVKNLITGSIIEKTFKGNDKVNEANLGEIKAQYLYHDENNYYFMNQETFDQFSLSSEQVGGAKNYLLEGTVVNLQTFDDKPIHVTLPVKMNFKVTKSEPGVKGNTAQNANKEVEIETGYRLKVPLFLSLIHI